MTECRVCGDWSVPTQKICTQCLMKLRPSYIDTNDEKKKDHGFDPFATCESCKNQDGQWDVQTGKTLCKKCI